MLFRSNAATGLLSPGFFGSGLAFAFAGTGLLAAIFTGGLAGTFADDFTDTFVFTFACFLDAGGAALRAGLGAVFDLLGFALM